MRVFWTFLTSLLLAVLPVEGHRVAVEQADACSSCGCCVQPNANPTPARAPGVTKTVQVDREARIEPRAMVLPAVPNRELTFDSIDTAQLRGPSVALFQRHCSLLI